MSEGNFIKLLKKIIPRFRIHPYVLSANVNVTNILKFSCTGRLESNIELKNKFLQIQSLPTPFTM